MTANPVAGRSFIATFGLVFLAIAALFAADTFLARTDRAESQIEAARLFQQGQSLLQKGDNVAAVQEFNDALAIERDNKEYTLKLAEAQLAAGQNSDSEAALTSLLNANSTDGPANLLMARVLRKEGRLADAVSFFHRAVYGHWKQDPEGNRRRARLELIDLLAQQNSKEELLAELLQLDPALGGLSAGERWRRSVAVIEFVQNGAASCLKPDSSPELRELAAKAAAAVKAHVSAAHEAQAADANLRLADQLWQVRRKECQSPASDDDAPALVLKLLAR